MSIAATSGVVSNIDYESLITQLVNVKRQSITQLETEKSTLENKKSAYGTLNTAVTDLMSAADDLKSADAFKVFTSTVSDETILGATVGSSSSASKGTYSVTVNSIARSHKIAADGVASDTSTVASGPGSFSFQAGAGAVQTVSVDATTTLAGLKDAINGLNAGVTATLVNDGGATNPWRLILTSDNTGTANAVTITQNDTSLAFSTTLQAAQDASIMVDGLTFTRPSNTITDIISGVTLDLKSSDPARTVTVGVDRDTAEISKKLTALVDNYNAVISWITSNNRYDTETKTAGAFFGETVARSVWDDLRKVMQSSVSGLPDTMNRLLHVGITTDKDGVMSLDSAKLDSALSSDFDGVVKLFQDSATTKGFGGLVYDAANGITDFADGRITVKNEGLAKNISYIEDDITRKETEVNQYEEQLRAQFTGLETMLAGLKNQQNYLSSL
ncbi:MAG: flagellar filament capping protein FliD [Deltaproteobacteria bacterium]|nr:flagellar filament capping protein FliD [Deltaproteobacteria bacterium]